MLPFGSWAQYNANTSTAVISYPSAIPCPASSCSSGGSLTGANTILTLSDFGNTVTRVTDINTYSPGSYDYHWSQSGGAFLLPMDISDTRFVVWTSGNAGIPFAWNPVTLQATRLYGSNYWILYNYTDLVWSYTQPYVAYGLGFSASYGAGNPVINSFNFSSTATAPTPVQLVDLSTCVHGLSGLGYKSSGSLAVSQDDQTFMVALSTTSGQGSAGMVYVVVWNRANGCRVWNTSTGAVTGSWGTTGTVSVPDEFTLHNAILGAGGTWALVAAATCLNNGCAASPLPIQEYFWNIATLTVNGISTSSNACGHMAIGFNNAVNSCDVGGPLYQKTWFERTMASPNQTYMQGAITSGGIPDNGTSFDQHPSWSMDNSTDTAPFCTSTFTGAFAEQYAYDNEILCISPTTGTVSRMAHTYNSTQSQEFYAKQAIGAVSADGKWFLWTSDWNGMLGNTNGASNTCTLGTTCRSDVFIMALPQSKIILAPPSGLAAVVE